MHSISTIKELLIEATQQLASLDNARLDAELLLCTTINYERSKLFTSTETLIPDYEVSKYRGLVKKRQAGIPLAYLTGKKEFWSMEFMVNPFTLIPRPETECLVENALRKISLQSNTTLADLGTGCGAIAISIASERPHCSITATDKCEKTLDVAVMNAKYHSLENIQFIKSDWYENLQGKFDVIVSNPPYVKSNDDHLLGDGVAHEPVLALDGGPDGLSSINKIISNSAHFLNRGGWLIIEHGFNQAHSVRNQFKQKKFTDVITNCDFAGNERVTMGRIL